MQVYLTEGLDIFSTVIALVLYPAWRKTETAQDKVCHKTSHPAIPVTKGMYVRKLMLNPGSNINNRSVPIMSLSFSLLFGMTRNLGQARIQLSPKYVHSLLYQSSWGAVRGTSAFLRLRH
jgi:hypothetical protein